MLRSYFVTQQTSRKIGTGYDKKTKHSEYYDYGCVVAYKAVEMAKNWEEAKHTF